MAERRTGSGQAKHDCGLIARAKRSRVRQLGVEFLQFAIVVPALAGLTLAIAEPLMVMHRYNGVHHMLTEIADDARGNSDLQGDFWNTGAGAVYDKFKAARLKLSQRFASGVKSLGGVTAQAVKHLDRVGNTVAWEELSLGYLPPTTSALVPGWNEGHGNSAALNNSHACGVALSGSDESASRRNFSARKRGENHDEDEDSPKREAVGARADCRIKQVASSELSSWQSLPSVSTKVPTELSAAVEIKGIFSTYPMTVTVPFFPRIPTQTTVQGCTPKWTAGAWSDWTALCGPGTRSRTDADSCSNSRNLSESRCQQCWVSQAGWPLGSNNNEWSSTCQSDGNRRKWTWELDTGGCASPVRRYEIEVAGCKPGETCGWTTKTGEWSTTCDGEGRKTQSQWSENACGDKTGWSTNYSGGWRRTWTDNCSVTCGGGTRSYTNTNACGGTSSGVERCNEVACCDYHLLVMVLEGSYGIRRGKTVKSGPSDSCVSLLVDEAVREAGDEAEKKLFAHFAGLTGASHGSWLGWFEQAFGRSDPSGSVEIDPVYLSADCSVVLHEAGKRACSHVEFGF